MKRKKGGGGGDSGRSEERVVFGQGPVGELLEHRAERLVRLYCTAGAALADAARANNIPVEEKSRRDLDEIAGAGARHQGVVAIAGAYQYADVEDLVERARGAGRPALIVALDQVTDPHNLGAILRSAYLFGADGVVIPKDRAAPVNAVVTKVSAGASELVDVARVGNLARALDELKEAGLWHAALAAGPGAIPLSGLDATSDLGLVLGSEGSGIRRLVAERCDYHVEIPMTGTGVGSLNVSVAAGVALYEVHRQRRERSRQ